MPPQTTPPPRQPGWSTRSVHSGDKRPFPHYSLNLPIFQTATYTFNDSQDLSQFMQARMWGPVEGRTESFTISGA